MAKLIVTDHAIQRYKERVSTVGSHKSDFRKKVESWCENALKHSKQIGTSSQGRLIHRFSDYLVVTDANKRIVITIKPTPYSVGLAPESEETLRDAIKRQVQRMVRPIVSEKHELIIKIHENELKRIRVHHPETKKKISQKIEELNERLDEVTTNITAHSALAYQYGVNIEEDI